VDFVTLVSYAQNFEDVILWRALKSVAQGCYVDIGANDPVIDSVSLAFYERGWRGLHVEPMPEYATSLRAARPDETVIEAAIGVGSKATELFSFTGTGLTTSRRSHAAQHRSAGHKDTSLLVPTRSLESVFDEVGPRDIHWLKIDVEGMERDVLASWNSSPVRPWIVVIESTLPNSPVENAQDFEPLIIALGYSMVYFDGLNRFYLHQDHADIRSAFGPGPNYFDHFTLTEHSAFVLPLRARLHAAEAESQDRRATNLGLMTAMQAALSAQAVEASDSRVRLDAALAGARQELVSARAEAVEASRTQQKAFESALSAQALEASDNRTRLDAALAEARQEVGRVRAEAAAASRAQHDAFEASLSAMAIEASDNRVRLDAALIKATAEIDRLTKLNRAHLGQRVARLLNRLTGQRTK
jgi:FkbM family methyltransferase